MSIQRIQDTRRIVGNSTNQIAPDGRGICTLEPYFEKGAASSYWIYLTGIVPPNALYEQELVLVSNDNYFYQNANLIPGNIGFIITIKELSPGKQVVVAAKDVQIKESMSQPGRYTGVLPNVSTPFTLECAVYSAGIANGLAKITELFFFNADLYTYEDFLQSPIAVLEAEQKKDASTISMVYPRLGWASVQPSDLIVGRWLGNQLYYSEEVQQSQWAKGGVSVSANAATAPDGTNTADRVTSSANGRVYQRNPDASMVGEKTFSVWVKAVSGTVAFQVKVTDGLGTVENEVAYTADTNWKRYFVTGIAQEHGYGAEIGVNSITGIDIWGMQIVDGTTPGAYTKTTTALLPPGTVPSVGATEIPANAPFRVGDRLENISWDGKFSTPIAWVCATGGNPGIWKPVYLFDALNSTKDPYFYGYASNPWLVGGSPILSGLLTAPTGSSITQSAPCLVTNELVTYEETIVSSPGGVSSSPRISNSGLGNSSTPGSRSIDHLVSGVANPLQVFFTGGSGNIVLSKCLVRPKYPFLTKAPASFTALPPVASTYNSGLFNVWNILSVGLGITYAAGELTMGAFTDLFILCVPLVKGKTYRLRINITVAAPSDTITIRVGSGGNFQQIAAAGDIGIKEATFVALGGESSISVVNGSNAGTPPKINYARFYAE